MKDYFETSLNLSVDDKTRQYTYFGATRTAGIHKSDHSGGSVIKTVRIHNGRGNAALKLDESSFELVDCPTALSTQDFYAIQEGNEELKEKYYEEVKVMVKKQIGCNEVLVLHHQVRNENKMSSSSGDGIQGYATHFPHTDSSPVSGDELALQMAAMEGLEAADYKRYLYLNLWRNISDEPIQNDYLAMLDERTVVKPDDYITKDLFGNGYNVVQYSLNARHVERHKWYYYPRMTKDEGILFKQMDSDFTKPGRICFHTSAHDDEIKDHPTRESIEIRLVCYWKKTDDPDEVNSMPSEENINLSMIKDPLEVALQLSHSTFISNPFVIIRQFFNLLLGKLLGTTISNEKGPPYSGNPKDYEDRFVNGIKYFRYWPKQAVAWGKGVMSKHGTPEEGVAEITKHLVNDVANHNKTKYFSPKERKEITDYLLSDSGTYMKVAKEALAGLKD